nr:ribosomal protein S4 [Gastrodia longistyla]
MPAFKFQTCRLLPGNVRNRELSLIQRRILRRLRNKRRSMKRNLSIRENLNSNIKSQTTRKLPLSYGGRDGGIGSWRRRTRITNGHLAEGTGGRFLGNVNCFLLNQETRSDVIPVRLHLSDTLPQARQPISHRRVCVNNGLVSITHLKVSQGDLISLNLKENDGEAISRYFYIDISVSKIIGKFLPVRMWRRTKTEWFRLLKTQRGCRLLLKSRFLQELRSSMQEEDLERTKKAAKVCLGSSFAEHNRMKINCFNFKSFFLSKRRNDLLAQSSLSSGSPFFYKSSFYSNSTYCSGSILTRKIRIKKRELPTHYSEVNHRTLKAVVSYGPHIGHIPNDIRLKDPNLPLRSA